MFRRRLQKIGSLLGLIAILMSALAPTVSQALAARESAGVAHEAPCAKHAASHDMGDMAGMGDGHDSSHALMHWQACGYCGLFAHAPVLPGVVASFAAALTATRAPVFAEHDEVRAAHLYIAAQPRAPPVIS